MAEPYRENNHQMKAIVDSITDGLISLDTHWQIVYVNSWMATMFAKGREALLGQCLWDVAPVLLETPFEKHYRAALSTQLTVHFEAFYPASQKWVEVHVYPSKEGIAIYMLDKSEQKQQQEEQHKNHEALQMITDMIPQLVWTARPDGFLDYFNKQCFPYLGMTMEQLEGHQWIHVVHPDDQPRAIAAWKIALRTGSTYMIEYRLREGKTGNYQWFLTRAAPLIDKQGKILKWFGTATNIDESKHIERALQESEARFHGLVDSNIIGVIILHLEGQIYEANDAFLRIVGYSREEMVVGHLQWADMTTLEGQVRTEQAQKELLATGSFQPYEKELLAKGGKPVPVLIGGTIFRWEGTTPLVIAFVLDQTAHKVLDQQKDLFLGMTGHELKTPLAGLKGTLQLIKRRLKREQTLADHLSPHWDAFIADFMAKLESSLRQIDVQTRLINDLLDVSRITTNTLKLFLERCDLISLVRQIVEDLRVVAPERTLLLALPEDTTINVMVDQDRIHQVLINYVTNAIRYSPPEQPIQIGMLQEQGTVRVWVQDKGPGLTKEAQKDIWESFHQEKGIPLLSGSGKGLGLGLYICHMLVKQHQGDVGVDSIPGEGSTFWFSLPVIP